MCVRWYLNQKMPLHQLFAFLLFSSSTLQWILARRYWLELVNCEEKMGNSVHAFFYIKLFNLLCRYHKAWRRSIRNEIISKNIIPWARISVHTFTQHFFMLSLLNRFSRSNKSRLQKHKFNKYFPTLPMLGRITTECDALDCGMSGVRMEELSDGFDE
jgi:hypothetical protein